MKFIKQAKIESTELYTNEGKAALLEELSEAKKSGVDLSEYSILCEDKNYDSFVKFAVDRFKIDSSTFKEFYSRGFLKLKDLVEVSFENGIFDVYGKVEKGVIDINKINQRQGEEDKGSTFRGKEFYDLVNEVYPEYLSKKIVITLKAEFSLEELLNAGIPGVIADLNDNIRKSSYSTKDEDNAQGLKALDIDALEVRKVYDHIDNKFATMVVEEGLGDQGMIKAISLFSNYPQIQKTLYQTLPNSHYNTQERNKFILEKYLLQNKINTEDTNSKELSVIIKFAESVGIQSDVEQDFSKSNIFHSFKDIIANNDIDSIQRIYKNFINVEKGMKEHSNSQYLNPILSTGDPKTMKMMLDNFKELQDPQFIYSGFENLKKPEFFSAFLANIEHFPGLNHPKRLNTIINNGKNNNLLDETFTALKRVGISINKIPDISDILESVHNEENCGKNLHIAIKHGYNPMKLDNFVQKIVTARKTKLITALKKEGLVNPKSNSFFGYMVKSHDTTSSFDKYRPDVLDSSVWNFKTHDNSILWWNINQESLFQKVKKISTDSPNELKISSPGSNLLLSLYTKSSGSTQSSLKMRETLVETALHIASNTEQKLSINQEVDSLGQNCLHHLLDFNNFCHYNSSVFLAKILKSEVLDKSDFKTVLSQKDNQGKYPMDSFLEIYSSEGVSPELRLKHDSTRDSFLKEFKKFIECSETTVGKAFLEALHDAPNSHNVNSLEYIFDLINYANKGNAPIRGLETIEYIISNHNLSKHFDSIKTNEEGNTQENKVDSISTSFKM